VPYGPYFSKTRAKTFISKWFFTSMCRKSNGAGQTKCLEGPDFGRRAVLCPPCHRMSSIRVKLELAAIMFVILATSLAPNFLYYCICSLAPNCLWSWQPNFSHSLQLRETFKWFCCYPALNVTYIVNSVN
jgi:hypothetical protein